MTLREIVDELARGRVVEEMVQHIAHRSLTPELHDLAQEVYVALLCSDEERIEDMYRRGQLRYYIARIVTNQYRSSTSPFYTVYRLYGKKSRRINGND